MGNADGTADAGETVIARYEYDALNRRTKIFANADTDDDFDSFQHFFYNAAWQILETRLSESENTGPETLQPEYQYVWSLRYIDAAVLRDKNTDTDDLCDDERLYYLNDANMNVTALLDTDGAVLERYIYDPYGKPSFLAGNRPAARQSIFPNPCLRQNPPNSVETHEIPDPAPSDCCSRPGAPKGSRRESVGCSQTHGRGLGRCSEGPAKAWDAGNLLAETPKPGRIVNIAGGGRQRASGKCWLNS